MRDELAAVLMRLEQWGAHRAWVGPDPYEGLNSPLGGLARSKRTGQAVIQVYKRLPFVPPWPLRAQPMSNSKALALALSGYAAPAGHELPNVDLQRSRLAERLTKMNTVDNGAGWGYHFDAQTRHLFYARDTPNAIATCFVVGALIDLADATGDKVPAELALKARPFLLSLARESPGRGPFFAYVGAGSELIHNANLMVCGVLARLHELAPDRDAEAIVRSAAATTLRAQRADGLWRYGEAENLAWADNFHTAYVLEAICELSEVFDLGRPELERGLEAWRTRFFEPDGWARYYADRRYPLEPHSCASAIDLVYTALRRDPERDDRRELITFASNVASMAVSELWLPGPGCFGFRRSALGLNRRVFMRWTNAPMFRALSRLESLEEKPTP